MKTAIVILNWNGRGFLEKYLPILCGNTPQPDACVVVADNGSTDGSMEWLEAHFPQVEQIRFDRNYGFTGGYNRALAQVEAEYFILLNSDIRIPAATPSFNWLQPLLDFMEAHPQAGICQPKVLSEPRPSYFEYAGACGGFLDRYGFPFCRGRILSCTEEDKGQYDTLLPVFWASGACLVIRSSVWRQLGGLDERFFAHMEEIDLCWRAQIAGYQVWAVPQSHVFHVGGGTLPNNSPRKLYLNYRNNLLMLYKNLPREKRHLIFTRMCLDGLSGGVYLLQGKVSYLKAVWRAHTDFRKMKQTTQRTPYPAESKTGSNFKTSEAPAGITKLPAGWYPKSIILAFFTGKKKFSQLDGALNVPAKRP